MRKIKNLAAAPGARPRLAASLAWAAALLLAAALYAHYSPFLTVDDVWFLDEAEAFYHGLPVLAGLDSMPLTGYCHSLLAHHLPAWWAKIFLPFSVISLLAVSFSAGAALAGARCGALAAGLAGLAFLSAGGLVNWGRYFETAVFTLISGLMAAFTLYYRDEGRTRDAVILGLLTGASLLCRSTFFLFPLFILAALLLWRGRLKITWGAAAALVLLPYAMLVPWWLMRGAAGQEFALFEAFRGKANVITGLLGYVGTIEGSYQEALKLAGLTGTENLWTWGLGRLAADPWGIAGAVPRRAWAVLAYKPLFTLLSLASLFAVRLDDKARLLAAFCLYLALVHLPMPVEPRYFVPLLIPLAALIARAAALRLWPDCAARSGPSGRAAAWLLAALILACVPGLYARMSHYASSVSAANQAAVLAREAAAFPGDRWLTERTGEADFAALHQRALELQDAGRHAESLRLLEALLQEQPRAAALWSDKGMQELRLGNKAKARDSFRKAIELDQGFIPAYLNLLSVTPEKAEAEKLRAAALAALRPRYSGLRPLLSGKK